MSAHGKFIAGLIAVGAIGGVAAFCIAHSRQAEAAIPMTSTSVETDNAKAWIFDVKTPAGHNCTVALMNDYRGGVAMHCWN